METLENTVERLCEHLGKQWKEPLSSQWKICSGRLVDYVYNKERNEVIDDYGAIKKYITDQCKVCCIEVDTPVEEIAILKGKEQGMGRLGVRILDFLGPSKLYIVLQKELRPPSNALVLLHEIGHLALQFAIYESMSVLYYRICMNPAMEFKVGRFLNGERGKRLKTLMEKESDFFALTWLMPLWMDEIGNKRDVPEGFTREGYKYKLLRELLGEKINGMISSAKIESYNTSAEEMCLSSDTLLWHKMYRLLLRRPESRVEDITTERCKLMVEYFQIVDYPTRFVPELTQESRDIMQIPHDREHELFKRMDIDEAEYKIDSDLWEPFLISPLNASTPAYYIPITPVPSKNPLDSQVEWRHMAKADYSLPFSFTEWTMRAKKQRAGLLVFPRNPAERKLDTNEMLR